MLGSHQQLIIKSYNKISPNSSINERNSDFSIIVGARLMKINKIGSHFHLFVNIAPYGSVKIGSSLRTDSSILGSKSF